MINQVGCLLNSRPLFSISLKYAADLEIGMTEYNKLSFLFIGMNLSIVLRGDD